MNNRVSITALLATAMAFAGYAQAQPSQPLPPPPPNEPVLKANPMVAYLQERHKISRAEAQERVDIQGEIAALLENPAFFDDPDFAGVVVQDEPVYRIYLTYYDNSAKSELLRLVPPKMRRYVQIKQRKLNKGQVERGIAAIETSLAGENIVSVVSYQEGTEQFIVQAPGSSESAVMAASPQQYRRDIVFEDFAFPEPEQSYTTGSTSSGYYANAGYNIGCTMAFPITYTYGGVSNRQGALTAGHCFDPDDPDRILSHPDGTQTVFKDAVFRRAQNDLDFAIIDTTGMTTNYWIYFWNKQGVGGFPNSSWLRTKNFIRKSASWIGMNVCKQGQKTGLTCGKVVDLDYPYSVFGGGNFVKVSNTLQSDLSDNGDSGGPWFTSVSSRYEDEVSALGLHVTGAGTGSSQWALYMPIDKTFSVPNGPTNVRLFTTP